jgi:hypothetical protein
MLQVAAVLWTLRCSDVDPDDGWISYPRNVGTEFHFDMSDCPTKFNEFVRRESLKFYLWHLQNGEYKTKL